MVTMARNPTPAGCMGSNTRVTTDAPAASEAYWQKPTKRPRWGAAPTLRSRVAHYKSRRIPWQGVKTAAPRAARAFIDVRAEGLRRRIGVASASPASMWRRRAASAESHDNALRNRAAMRDTSCETLHHARRRRVRTQLVIASYGRERVCTRVHACACAMCASVRVRVGVSMARLC